MSPEKKKVSAKRKKESNIQRRPKRREAEEERLKNLPKFRSVNVAIPLGPGKIASGGNAIGIAVSRVIPSITRPVASGEVKGEEPEKKKLGKLLPPGAAIPSVSAPIPPVSEPVPFVARRVPLVSGKIPLVSEAGKVTLPVAWKKLPSREWSKIKIPVSRKRRIAPLQIPLSQFLALLIPAAPFFPMIAIKEIAEAIQEQAEEERDPKVALVQELLELKMRYEMKEISKEEYEKSEKELDKRLKKLNKS